MSDKKIITMFVAGILGLIISCGDRNSTEERPIVKVNDYVITERGFRQELAASTRMHDIVGLTPEDKRDLLNERIRKELLIQEAVKRGLDKEETFRQTIENYWEQTLITALLKAQISHLVKDIIVTRDEIEERHREMKKSNPKLQPVEKLMLEIEKEIREEKKTAALEKWIEDLQKDAEITIYEDNLRAMR